jgi:hypothetical protein
MAKHKHPQHPHVGRVAEVYIRTPLQGRDAWLGYTVEPIVGAEWHPHGYWLLPADSDWRPDMRWAPAAVTRSFPL